MGRDVNGRGFNPCDPAGLWELEAVSQNLGGKGETIDYPELRLLYYHLQRERVRWPWARAVIGQS